MWQETCYYLGIKEVLSSVEINGFLPPLSSCLLKSFFLNELSNVFLVLRDASLAKY